VRAIERAWKSAGHSPAQVGLMEAHGTGTVVGDRTELDSMTDVLRDAGAVPGTVTLGSVKSQIGHTKCAAGIAALIKVCLALHHRALPPTLHIQAPNSSFDAETSPFIFRETAAPWAPRPVGTDGSVLPRIGALSSFGFGGTNFHAVIEEHDDPLTTQTGLAPWPAELFLLRGKTRADAVTMLDAIEAQLDVERPWRLRDLARSACETHTDEPVQIAFVATSLDELRTLLRAARDGESGPRLFQRSGDNPGAAQGGKVAFLFSGQGSQYTGMAADLFVAFPCLAEILQWGARWSDRVWPARAFSPAERKAQDAALMDTRVAQPALGMVELAGARILEVCGVRADMLAGHSYGELAALAVSGALDPAELFDLSEARGRAILDAAGDEPGKMAAVSAGPEAIGDALRGVEGLGALVLANLNAPLQTVLSGPTDVVEAAVARLEESGIAVHQIPVACAFHSSVVAGAEPAYAKRLAEARVSTPSIPVWSNTSATPYPENDPDAVRAQLARHLTQPVRFTDQIRAMHADGARVFIEVGPGRVLTGLVGKILGDAPHVAVSTDVRGEPGIPSFLTALARLAVEDVAIDSGPIFAGRRAERFDLLAPPERRWPPMTWLVDGFRSRPLTGQVPVTGLIPMERPPTPMVPAGSLAASQADAFPEDTARGGSREAVVLEYLRNVRELVESQRQVVLGYLGTTPADLAAPVIAAPVAATPVAPAPAGTTPDQGPADDAAPPQDVDLETTLLAIVSERTGYPLEMLDMDLDMEADLGIDSIKRIEILGALNEAAGLAGADEDRRDELVEQLATIKTLRGILEWLEENNTDQDTAASESSKPDDNKEVAPAAARRPNRFLLHIEETPRPETDLDCLKGCDFRITDDGDGLARALTTRLEEAGASSSLVNGKSSVDFTGVDGLIHLATLPKGSGPKEVKRLFTLARQAVEADVRWIFAATGMGGSFGVEGNGFSYEGQGGVAGLLKSLAKERKGLRVRALDLDPHAGVETLAGQIMVELTCDDQLVEVAWNNGKRHSLRAVATGAPTHKDHRTSGGDATGATWKLESDSVVLITGGARGITAQAAMELARRANCTLELVGRSPLPDPKEDPATSGATNEVALKRLLAGLQPDSTPVELGQDARRILAAREVRATLTAIEASGARVNYHSIDVRDDNAFSGLVRDIYKRHGRLDGVIHGAGVVEDKLLIHKSADSFDRVFDTKVQGALTLARTLRDDIGFVIFFSSISATFGNRGQSDYAAANDVLDKLAHYMNGRLAGRVCSINWGPWDSTGMVSPELRREYDRRGIGLIDLKQGAVALLEEILHGDKDASQVILMSADPESFS
jgi:malonyl CoA-acyl carrier protein transacylase/NAD(P)-dependent dehydrogenase (short-subunit alcohol dehydrogenase family)